jgi:hypothetical protein
MPGTKNPVDGEMPEKRKRGRPKAVAIVVPGSGGPVPPKPERKAGRPKGQKGSGRKKAPKNAVQLIDHELLRSLTRQGFSFYGTMDEYQFRTGVIPSNNAVSEARRFVAEERQRLFEEEHKTIAAETIAKFEANADRALKAWQLSLEQQVETTFLEGDKGATESTRVSPGRPSIAALGIIHKAAEAIAKYAGLDTQIAMSNVEAARALLESQGYAVTEPSGGSLDRIEIVNVIVEGDSNDGDDEDEDSDPRE